MIEIDQRTSPLMNFNDFWKWLCSQGRVIKTLGGRREFGIRASSLKGVCLPCETGKRHHFDIFQAKATWDRYQGLPVSQKDMAGQYVDPNWKKCPNRTCCPWIAAAIRDFLAGRQSSGTCCPEKKS
jgi:hypothetical protein